MAQPPPRSDREFLDNFCTVVSFVSRLDHTIRASRLLVTVRVFCQSETASKSTKTYHFGDKNVFSREAPSP